MRFLCARDFAPLELQYQSEVYGARGCDIRVESPAAAGRVDCKHSHHGFLSENVGVVERAVAGKEGRAAARGGSLILLTGN